MDAVLKSVTRLALEKFPRKSEKFIQYGTAGFRTRGVDLPHVIYRMGILAVLRSKIKKATIGVMITASHNPEDDNGVKLVDPMGEMLEALWEDIATRLANVPDAQLAETLSSLIEEKKIDMGQSASVSFARDTRPSSELLAQALQAGIEVMQGMFQDYGLLTTPQLHYMVRCKNSAGGYGKPTEEGYYEKLTSAFLKLHAQVTCTGRYSGSLYLDAANGVGAMKIREVEKYIAEALTISLYNDGSQGKLNDRCGADFVKTGQCAPNGIPVKAGVKCASFDGDADRIVYFYVDDDGSFHLLDGDRMATLVAGFLQGLIQSTGLDLKIGLVQTAYANGSSTNYITQQLKVPVACVPTGVKHLHHKAQDFDVGVYFEANGHGTVLFSDRAMEKVEGAVVDSSLSSERRAAADKLKTVIDLINQTVGDAISDMLLVETVLHCQGWGIQDWKKCYTDLPNRQSKVTVKDRTVIQTTDAERKTTSPPGLQEAIDKLVAVFNQGRSFVRPSGTEDIVRVYAEADTQANADKLAYEVSLLVYRLAGGIGEEPKLIS
ncbi:hypothetical protein ACJMK2_005191 [Sinanodonta woodiana]|uniref:Phosphoacetylglucosamine mutase n=1 Tax=Sinanodonta woodiana TaxID=1069815 RepID=A0ABD3VPB2_SINWO